MRAINLPAWGLLLSLIMVGCGGGEKQHPQPPDSTAVVDSGTVPIEPEGPYEIEVDSTFDSLRAIPGIPGARRRAAMAADSIPIIDSSRFRYTDSVGTGYRYTDSAPIYRYTDSVASRFSYSDSVRVIDTTGWIVTQPPPPPPPPPTPNQRPAECVNEPPGLTMVSLQPWDAIPPDIYQTSNPASWDQYGWGRQRSYQLANTVIHNGVMRFRWAAGFRGGSAPHRFDLRFQAPKNRVYWCVRSFFDPNWTNGGNSGTKWGFLIATVPGQTNHVWNFANQFGFLTQNQSVIPSRNYKAKVGGGTVALRGRWITVEFFVDASKGTMGSGRIWVNGTRYTLTQSTTNLSPADDQILWFGPGQTQSFQGLTINGTYGGGSNPVPYTMWNEMDWIYVSTN